MKKKRAKRRPLEGLPREERMQWLLNRIKIRKAVRAMLTKGKAA